MPNAYFKFKNFTVYQDRSAMKVTTDACLFGAWCAAELNKIETDNKKALDIGTGTGLLAMMIAQKNKLLIDAVEIDENASQQAKENIEASSFVNFITLYNNNIINYTGVDYDFIFSNPPFYENDLSSPDIAKNIAHHSRSLNWQQLFSMIKQQLHDTGIFFLLLPFKRIHEIENLLKRNSLYVHQWVEVKQTNHHAPFRLMISGGKIKKNLEINQIIIKENKVYTDEFKELLKDYYLYL